MSMALAFASVGPAEARTGERVTPPDLRAVALAPSDFAAGTRTAFENQGAAGKVTSFVRFFQPPVKLGTARMSSVLSVVRLYPDKRKATNAYTDGARSFGTAAFRKSIVTGLAGTLSQSSGQDVRISNARFGKATAAGPDGRQITLSVVTTLGTLDIVIAFAHLDRLVTEAYLYSTLDGSLPAGIGGRVLGLTREHARVALTVAVDGPPLVGGTAAQGQKLTADVGSWTGGPTSFAYAWLRCDSTGANCAPIAGAAGKTYTVAAEDAGSTLRVDVTGANSVSSFKATSPVTLPVPAPAPPPAPAPAP